MRDNAMRGITLTLVYWLVSGSLARRRPFSSVSVRMGPKPRRLVMGPAVPAKLPNELA